MHFSQRLLMLLLLWVLFACKDEPEQKTLFSELPASRTGITFINENKETETENILSYEYFYNGGGVAVGDINNDGLVDIFFTSNQGEDKLYLNKGNFQFEDITTKAGVSGKSGWKTGAAMADINGDGLLDIYVCRSGNQHEFYRFNSFYINQGDLTFKDQATSLGLNDNSYSTQAVFFDYDNDDDLDVFVLNHSRLQLSNSYDISRRFNAKRVSFVGNRLYRNDSGVFKDVSDSVGIEGPPSNYGLGVVAADLNNDGWTDLYTSNDYTEKDKLLFNRQGKFRDVGDSALSHMSQFSMGVDVGDINNDGLLDIVTVDMLPESNRRQKEFFWPDKYDVYAAMVKNGRHHQYMRNMLHVNKGDNTYSEIGQFAGISNTDWSWAPLFADYDNDGFLDLFITNGFKRNFTSNDFLKYKADLSLKAQQGKPIEPMADILNRMPSNAAHDYMFQNEGGYSFVNRSMEWGFEKETLSNGVAYADLDNDGDLDLIVNRIDTHAGIYQNNSRELNGNHFLKIRVQGKGKNTWGLGASATLYIKEKILTRTLSPFRGFQSSVEPLMFFGLEKESVIDSIIVRWPGNRIQKLFDVQADQLITVKQQDEPLIPVKGERTSDQWTEITSTRAFKHNENDFIDFKVQSLLPRMYSTQGPALAVSRSDSRGLRMVYVGGAKGQSGALFTLDKKGMQKPLPQNVFENDKASEDVDAVFFDYDNDGLEDLYVVSGGYEFDAASHDLRDRLYHNLGNGKFTEAALPDFSFSGSCVRPVDFDQDNDLDLFIGARLIPGRYPETPKSLLLENLGQGKFAINTTWLSEKELTMGLVTDAVWADVNNDKLVDLVVTGEWMPVTVFIQENGRLINRSPQFFKESNEGWWNCLHVTDIDKDGDMDIIAGNFGMNNQYKPHVDRPVKLYYDDFDKNGSIDLLLNYYVEDRLFPYPTRDELTDQLPAFKKRFPDYAKYTTATISTLLTKDELRNAKLLEANCFESSLFLSENGSFNRIALPAEAQFAPVFSIVSGEFSGDGNVDLLIGGNLSSMGSRFGKANGMSDLLFSGVSQNQFVRTSIGLTISGDVRKIVAVDDMIIVAVNNGVLKTFQRKR